MQYVLVVTHCFDTSYTAFSYPTEEEALRKMDFYLNKEVKTTRESRGYTPKIMSFCDTEKGLVYSDLDDIDTSNYYEHDYSIFKVIELEHDYHPELEEYVLLVTYCFDVSYCAVSHRTEESALETMHRFLDEDAKDAGELLEYTPKILTFSDTEKILVFSDHDDIDADNYFEQDYATYKIIHIEQDDSGPEAK